MSYQRPVKVLTAVVALLLLAAGPALATKYVVFDNHDVKINIDVPSHIASIEDSGTMTVFKGWNLLLLSDKVKIDKFSINGEIVERMARPLADSAMLPAKVRKDMPDIDTDGQPMLVLFHQNEDQTVEFLFKYSGEFFQDVSSTRFSNENVGGEITATIIEKGAYFSPASLFVAQADDTLCNFKLTVDIPAEWESICDGNRLSSDSADGRKVQVWENPYKSDGVYVFAAPFVIESMMTDSVEVSCYFFEEDASLISDYLTASADYIRMYNELIGPYPYQRFTVAENFFPTGYGMPGWTLLGQQVLRLPFIIHTSLGHEVLHNWWGNSVFVDYERGNWCEGITVYGADYRYKLLRSPDEALDYRKNILKQYVSYVNEGNDFPLREFQSRTSPETRTVGYNKAMMVFHMIEELIGTEAFFQAWKDVYAENIGQEVNWDQWLAAFEKTSGVNLSNIRPQWVDRTGAPFLATELVKTTKTGENLKVEFRLLEQSGYRYYLQVPVRFSGEGFVMDTSVILANDNSTFEMTVASAATTLEIDPDYHLFRRLHPDEVEPVISAVLGNPLKKFVCDNSNETVKTAFGEFGRNMTEDSVEVSASDVLDAPADGNYAIIFSPSEVPEYLKSRVKLEGASITIDGISYEMMGNTFILSGQDMGSYEKYMVIYTTNLQALPRIGELIPHYGKYSYLVFEGERNVGKGQWVSDHSPLKLQLVHSGADH